MERSRLEIRRLALLWVAMCSLQAAFAMGSAAENATQPTKRPVTVADAIEMTRLVDSQYSSGGSPSGFVAHFSPNNEKFVVVLRKGNLKENTNEFSLVLWKTSEIFVKPDPEIVLTLSSSSNREAIENVNWLDNETISLLGEQPGQLQQVYTFNVSTHVLSRLTSSPSSVRAYTIVLGGKRLVFATETPAETLLTKEARKEGVRISGPDSLPDLIAGHRTPSDRPELLLVNEERHCIPIHSKDPVSPYLSGEPLLSPDGRYLLVRTQTMHVPEVWKEYTEPFLRHMMEETPPAGEPTRVERYELIDTFSGDAQVLLDAPIGVYGSESAWAPDSHSIVLAGVYLPLADAQGEERKARRSSTFVVEVSVQHSQVLKIAGGNFRLLRWDGEGNYIDLATDRFSTSPSPRVVYKKLGKGWERLPETIAEPSRPDIIVKEDVNTSPKLFAVEPGTHRQVMLMDLNPQFSNLEFGKVQLVRWKGADEHEAKGDLYYPPSYVPGRRYPLIIQTHGFTSDRFWIDGPFTTAFAAQPLVAHGFLVLQVEETFDDPDTPHEVSTQVSSFEGAIDHFANLGMVDRDRVGIVGFSRTCIFVKHALVHSKYRFAAAVVADGTDAGYFQYIAFANNGSSSTFEGLNNGAPFGKNLDAWTKNVPGFNMDKVATPVLIQAIGPGSLLAEWEWFSGLTRLNRAVDMIYIPDGAHILEKPWERMTSQQVTVDWFCFWLENQETSDPEESKEYILWRKLREGMLDKKSMPESKMAPSVGNRE